ncbi:hypothetical protein IPJ72_00290 [Candidatus Peregrinibacteria bacterium]|nr:MAG: hypothetical protein IPJ72_00290 [Candidatus Peregrinibacteria bacterium]
MSKEKLPSLGHSTTRQKINRLLQAGAAMLALTGAPDVAEAKPPSCDSAKAAAAKMTQTNEVRNWVSQVCACERAQKAAKNGAAVDPTMFCQVSTNPPTARPEQETPAPEPKKGGATKPKADADAAAKKAEQAQKRAEAREQRRREQEEAKKAAKAKKLEEKAAPAEEEPGGDEAKPEEKVLTGTALYEFLQKLNDGQPEEEIGALLDVLSVKSNELPEGEKGKIRAAVEEGQKVIQDGLAELYTKKPEGEPEKWSTTDTKAYAEEVEKAAERMLAEFEIKVLDKLPREVQEQFKDQLEALKSADNSPWGTIMGLLLLLLAIGASNPFFRGLSKTLANESINAQGANNDYRRDAFRTAEWPLETVDRKGLLNWPIIGAYLEFRKQRELYNRHLAHNKDLARGPQSNS